MKRHARSDELDISVGFARKRVTERAQEGRFTPSKRAIDLAVRGDKLAGAAQIGRLTANALLGDVRGELVPPCEQCVVDAAVVLGVGRVDRFPPLRVEVGGP